MAEKFRWVRPKIFRPLKWYPARNFFSDGGGGARQKTFSPEKNFLALGFADRGISEGSLSFLKNIEENIRFLKVFQNSDEFPRGTYKNMLLRGVKLEDVVDREV